MLSRLFTYFLGSRNQRVLRRLQQTVTTINALESSMIALSDTELREKTNYFKQQLQANVNLDTLLPAVFATVREAAKRILKMRHFDVQLIGGMVLHYGNIAEMRTGEGKTLVATLSAYLNALLGKGVHIVTVNDYLAKRDAEWMRPLYEFLGLTVGINLHVLSAVEKKQAYAADITYGTNNEFGFDYLRDNMVFSWEDKVQRGLSYAIVDEVDSILIDEARTPLIISGIAEDSVELYQVIDRLVQQLLPRQAAEMDQGDYLLEEKTKQVHLTEQGHLHVEELLLTAGLLREGESLYDTHNIILIHHVYAALRSYTLFHRDIDYIVQRGEIIIVDEHTGRTMAGRRWSDGLHQAIEAKEKVMIQQENQTLASITFQNYFRLYQKLAGMTGTADTEAYEFHQIYQLEVFVIPTHQRMIREDNPDLVYLSTEEKFLAIIEDIKKTYQTRQPILVGTTSIETSEYLSKLLVREKIPHQVLNAKFHEKEAQIIAEAGRLGAVTIATNMAGRGTDIVLGGNLEALLRTMKSSATVAQQDQCYQDWQKQHDAVVAVGGLYVLGTERHESRRIDNQLRGRAGRQGDPGRSRFYLSLQDNLLRIFGGERLNQLMSRIGVEKGLALESRLLSRSIENAQRKVEAHNFDIRKQLLEYDDVANEQRRVIYKQRDELLLAQNIADIILEIGQRAIKQTVRCFIVPGSLEETWDIVGLTKQLIADFNLSLPLVEWLVHQENSDELKEDWICAQIKQSFVAAYIQKEQEIGPSIRQFEKNIMLQTLDNTWREHLAAMDYLRQGIHLRGYAQKNPKQEYKREAFALFAQLLDKVNAEVTRALSRITIEQLTPTSLLGEGDIENRLSITQSSSSAILDDSETMRFNSSIKVGRNDPCPCLSGKKYKQCHGQLH